MKIKCNFTIDQELVFKLKHASEESLIPQSRLVVKGIEKVLKEMGYIGEEETD